MSPEQEFLSGVLDATLHLLLQGAEAGDLENARRKADNLLPLLDDPAFWAHQLAGEKTS